MLKISQVLELVAHYEKLFIALDRDGTLVPYAKHPKEAFMSASTSSLVKKLASTNNTIVSIVSARSTDELQNDLDSSSIIFAGDYGMEICFPNQDKYINPFALQAVPELKSTSQHLQQIITNIDGAVLDNHKFSLCLHWHLVPKEELPKVHQLCKEVEGQLQNLKMHTLPTSYEFLPNISWNKSHALEEIEGRYLLPEESCLRLYIGDSASDEPAFLWTNSKGGVSIKVGDLEPLSTSSAQTFLPTPKVLIDFLTGLTATRLATGS